MTRPRKPQVKLSEAQRRQVVGDYLCGQTMAFIAKRFRISERTIYSITKKAMAHRCRCGHTHRTWH